MKRFFASLCVAIAVFAMPGVAQSFDLSGVTPTLTFPKPTPKPVPDPVTQGAGGINK